MKAILALENGITFEGTAFGDVNAESQGEVVFNTAMSGYQEALTDPSYTGQILTFTYPHIGNYGINSCDGESAKFQAAGVIVREYSKHYSNFRAEMSLEEYMKQNEILGIEGIDTRMLVRILRSEGAMRGIVSAKDTDAKNLVERAKNLHSMEGADLARTVSTTVPYKFEPNFDESFVLSQKIPSLGNQKFKVAAFDFGIKRNILRRLAAHNCEITIFPATTSAEEIREFKPDGIFLSNGPGDPAAVGYAIETIKKLTDFVPMFGICLGHQLLSLAFGATTYKMKFGHRGVNHPVKNLRHETIEITSQNHGFAVSAENLPAELELTHVNLNDSTVEGFRHRELPIFCVQYHPEAAPGTHDSDYLFAEFVELMQKN